MQTELAEFISLSNKFMEQGFSLYMVGGTVRDFLSGIDLTDMDVVTDATPDQMKKFIVEGDYTFSNLGCVRYKSNNVKFDITTLRKEKSYKDSRHPMEVEFVKDLKVDVLRRDFTVNAMYMDNKFSVIDFVNGRKDLNNRVLRMVGNPNKRIKEDPLRILRAIRFSLDYKLIIDKKLKKAMLSNIKLLDNLNRDKISMEIKKIHCQNIDSIKYKFKEFNIQYFTDMIH